MCEKRYGIESEIGSLEIETHMLFNADKKVIFRTTEGFFPSKSPKEHYRSTRYKELQYDFISTCSCRETSAKLNRIRHQEDGAKATTVRNQSEREGADIQTAMLSMSETAFRKNGFNADGHKESDTTVDFSPTKSKTAEREAVSAAAQEVGVSANFTDYEAADCAINISVDEVGCKHQTSKRPCTERKNEPKQVRNTVIHVQQGEKKYVIVGDTVTKAIRILMGFLLSNELLGAYPLVFFADGAKNIKSAVNDYFGFATYKYILDWPHLAKKTAELLSLSINGRKKRNEVHEKLKLFLWLGDTTGALTFLGGLPVGYVKSTDSLSDLKNYLERNRANIPCYAIRKKLGLRVSSNLGEKANDLAVSARQKHNGMSWSNEGSLGLASICVARLNAEMSNWLHHRCLHFAFDTGEVA